MALVTNNKESLHNGVNQQPDEMRLDTQVSEMINCLPTLDVGLRKRNPTINQELSESIVYPDEMWQHNYDKGLAGTDEEKYSIMINGEVGMTIVNVNSGKVYTEANGGIILSGNAAEYLYPFVDANGYAAVTVKDTTFITNKNVQPRMKDSIFGTGETTVHGLNYYDFNFIVNPNPTTIKSGEVSEDESLWITPLGIAPYSFNYKQHHYLGESTAFSRSSSITTSEEYNAAGVIFAIDGIIHSEFTSSITYSDTQVTSFGSIIDEYIEPSRVMTMLEFIQNCISGLTLKLGAGYRVESPSNGKIRVVKLDGTSFTSVPTMSASFPTIVPAPTDCASWYTYEDGLHDYLCYYSNPVEGNYLLGVNGGSINEDATIIASTDNYESIGFIWIKASEPVSGYTYTARVKIAGVAEQVTSAVTELTTELAASSLATQISLMTNVTATAVGSVLKIITGDGTSLDYVSTSDTFGNQASLGFAHTVATMNDLPKNLNFPDTLIKIEGTESSSSQTYWVKYDGSLWKETIEPRIQTQIDEYTMPYVLRRNDPAYPTETDFFSLKPYALWEDRSIGDNNSNPLPSFIQKDDEYFSPIKDIFFFKNRLGFITETTVVLSEVGSYGNFFRTTALTVLDSDVIDTTVDSTKAVRMEYAMYLDDSVMLFSDKAQFKLAGGAILSPKSVQVSKTSAYEMNKRVRPIFMNNSIFFVANRGRHSAVMEYVVTMNSEVSEAIDITAHVQTYIPGDVVELSGSSIDNMLFIRSTQAEDKIFVYKYYDKGNQRVQSAWFKWEFNGRIRSAFSLGKNLNMMIMRRISAAAEDWILADGTWSMSNIWDMDAYWVMNIGDIVETGQFEKIETAPISVNSIFLDNSISDGGTVYRSEIDFGKWVLDIKAKGIKTKRGHLQFKTVELNSEPGSSFYLAITDDRTNKTRTIDAKYTVGKKPLVMGNAEKMNLSVVSWTDAGFQINSVSYEGNYVSRNTPI